MNRKHLLAALRAKGYKGKVDLAEIKAFLLDEGGDAETIKLNGTEVKVAEIFAKAATFEADVETAETEASEDSNESEDAEADAVVTKRAEPQGKRGDGWRASGLNSQFSVHGSVREREKKRYESKIAATLSGNIADRKKQAVFRDADTAEAFGAFMRGMHAQIFQRSYEQEGTDRDIYKSFLRGKAGTNTYNNNDGGATVIPEFSRELIYLTEEYGVIRKLFHREPMSGDEKTVSRKTNIVTMSFIQEASAASRQNDNFDNVSLVARKAMALVPVTNEWLEDSAIGASDNYGQSFTEAQAKLEDQCGINGDGSATYGGFVGLDNALPSGAYFNGSGAWSAFTTGDFQLMQGRVQNIGNRPLAWLGSREFYFQVCQRLDKQTSQFKDLLTPGSFLGTPYYFSEVMPTTSASGAKSLYYGAFGAAARFGDRKALSIDMSPHFYFNTDEIALRARARIAINVHGDGRGTTYGPVVCLKATA